MDSQSLLQHSYFIAAAAVVLALVVLRIIVLRRRSQALSDFFRINGGSQYPYVSHPQNDSSYGAMRHGVHLAPLPAAYHPDRRVHAADTDALGRRLGAGEDWDGKDALPAYDNLDRPPKYIEASWSHGAPQPVLQSVVIQPSEGEQSGVAHPSTSDRVLENTTDQPFDDTHVVAGEVHVAEPIPPPLTHHDPADS